MPSQEGNEGCQEHNHEERQTCDPGGMPKLWDKDVPDREELKLIQFVLGLQRGWLKIPSPFVANGTFQAIVTRV